MLKNNYKRGYFLLFIKSVSKLSYYYIIAVLDNDKMVFS